MTHFQIDLLQEALFTLLRDKYAMPTDIEKYLEKQQLIVDTYRVIQTLRPEQPNPITVT